MLLRPLFPRPFPPGSGESVNLGKHVLVFCLCLFLCLVVVFAFVFILVFVCDSLDKKCSVWAQDVILTKSDEAKLSDLKAWFFWRGGPEVDRQNSDMSIVDVEDAQMLGRKDAKETFHSAQSYFLQPTTSLIFLSRKYMNEGKRIQKTLKDIERNWWR